MAQRSVPTIVRDVTLTTTFEDVSGLGAADDPQFVTALMFRNGDAADDMEFRFGTSGTAFTVDFGTTLTVPIASALTLGGSAAGSLQWRAAANTIATGECYFTVT